MLNAMKSRSLSGKTIKFTIIVYLLLSTSIFAQWQALTSNTTNALHGIHFPTKDYGYAVGTLGKVVRTSNGGATWFNMPTGVTDNFNSVYFTSDLTGYVAGENGRIIKTTNGGASWTMLTTGTTGSLQSIIFPVLNTGYAVGTGGIIIKTTNAGVDWTSSSAYHMGATDFNGVYFINNNTGWVCGFESYAKIRKTTDGGSSWTISAITTVTNALNSIRFKDANTGIAVGDGGVIVRTTNGGTNWSAVSSGLIFILRAVDCGSAAPLFISYNWYITGDLGKILKSTDNGATWAQLTSGTAASLYSVSCNSRDTVYTSGFGGAILRTYNGGGSFVGNINNENVPVEYSLSQNYPNPFNPATVIKFSLPQSGNVVISVSDVTGREVAQLLHQKMDAGSHEVRFDGSNLSSGIYFYRMTAPGFTTVKKMIMIK